MAYTNKSNIQNYLMIDISDSFDTQITAWISAAENYINNYTNRPEGFETSTDETRYYDGNGLREIQIDHFTTITSVDILELQGDDSEFSLTEGADDDYITFPYNESPKYKLILTLNSSPGSFFKGSKRIKVVADFGFSSTVPKDIELATTMLVAKIVEKGQRGGDVQQERLGDYNVVFSQMNKDAIELNIEQMLNRYKTIEV